MQIRLNTQDRPSHQAVAAPGPVKSTTRPTAATGPVKLQAEWLDRISGGATPTPNAPKTTW